MLSNRRITVSGAVSAFVDRDTLVKPYLGITGVSEDTLLTLWIASCQSQIERYCDRFIAQRTIVEEVYEQPNAREIVVSHSPIIAVTSIVDQDGVTVTSTDYESDLKSGVIFLGEPGERWFGDYVVSYTTGYATIPESIQVAMLELVKQARNDKDRNSDAVIVQSADTGSVTFKGAVPGVQQADKAAPGWPESVIRLLKPYRRHWA